MTGENTFLKNTAILGLSGIVVKILSAAYRIPLTRMIGAGGMGQYTAVFNLFMPFYSFAVAGITPAVSRLCSSGNVRSMSDTVLVRKKASLYFGIVSVIMVCSALSVSWVYAAYISSPLIFAGVALLCPNLMFATYEAVYKGISQGSMNMSVSARASMLESGAKTVIGISSVYIAGILIRDSRDTAQLICAFATVSVCGFICLMYMSSDFRKTYSTKEKSVMDITAGTLFSLSVPVSLSALVVSRANFCDTVVCLSVIKKIPDSTLMAAYPFVSFTAVEEKAIWLFGVYQGLCLSVVNLIPSLSSAIGASGLPVITRAVSTGQEITARRQTERLIKLTAICVVPVSFFVMFFSHDVLITLYGDNGAQNTLAAFFLKIMAPVAILSAFSFPVNSIIHAMGKSASVFRITAISCAIKIILSISLCSVGRINIMGCIVSQIIFNLSVFFMSLFTVRKVCPPVKIIQSFFVPAVLSYILCTFVRTLADSVLYTFPVPVYTVLCGGLFVLMYCAAVIFAGFFIDKHRPLC